MTPEHFQFIVDKFELLQYSSYTAAWIKNLQHTTTDGWSIQDYGNWGYAIRNKPRVYNVIVRIPNEELAKEILQCIKDTEILFL